MGFRNKELPIHNFVKSDYLKPVLVIKLSLKMPQ